MIRPHFCFSRFTVTLLAALGLACAPLAYAAKTPKIAVTDLSFEDTVSGYFESVEVKAKRSGSSSSSYRDSDYSSSERESARMREDVSVKATREFETHISRGELRKFTADIKGQLIKGGYQLVQGKPWTATNTEKLYDIIGRIKQGYYPGADYVLWGNINNVEFRQDVNPIQGTNGTVSSTLALELVGEFSLINTRTYEVRAAFTAMGEGSDTKLLTGMGGRVTNNRSRVMMDVSRSLGEAVASEVEGQFAEGAGASSRQRSVEVETTIKEEKVIRYQ